MIQKKLDGYNKKMNYSMFIKFNEFNMPEYCTYYDDNTLYEKIEIDELRILHGLYRSYYRSGNKKMELYYNRGIINGCGISWYETGEIHAQFTYDNGELIGNPMIYSDSGKIE